MVKFYNNIKKLYFIIFTMALCLMFVGISNFLFCVLFILMCPLTLGAVNTIFLTKVNNKLILKINLYTYLYSFYASTFFFLHSLFYRNNLYVKLYDFFFFEDFIFSFDLYFNNITVIMFYVVVSISFFVIVFSIWYMAEDPNILKFLSLISYFSFFMLILVTANNVILIFVGWEGIGLFSYLLINFWNTRINANRSAFKAILINKIGDCFFYAFMFLYFFLYKTFSIYESSGLMSISKNDSYISGYDFNYVLIVLLIIASMAKSAQIILHVWLPDAMEGPTPVSALLHAATMVTAGIFVLLKFNFLIDNSEEIYKLILWIGLLTNLFASTVAIFQKDIKKIIAYSTASQIGIIYISLGIAKINYSIFHIFNHAFYKAFLFIMAGILIHHFANAQDLRSMSKLLRGRYFFYVCIVICSFSLLSFPFFSGYYSKELIINSSYLDFNLSKSLGFYLLNISAITTCGYSFKILYYLYYSQNSFVIRKDIEPNDKVHDKYFFNFVICVCFILALFSVFGGYLASNYFNNWFLNISLEDISILATEILAYIKKIEMSVSVNVFYFIMIISNVYIIMDHFKLTHFAFLQKYATVKFYFNDLYAYVTNWKLIMFKIHFYIIDKSYAQPPSLAEIFTKIEVSILKMCMYCYKNKFLVVCSFFLMLELVFLIYYFEVDLGLVIIQLLFSPTIIKMARLIEKRFF